MDVYLCVDCGSSRHLVNNGLEIYQHGHYRIHGWCYEEVKGGNGNLYLHLLVGGHQSSALVAATIATAESQLSARAGAAVARALSFWEYQ